MPTKEANLNLSKALNIFKNYGSLDIGQSLIVQNEIVLGLEAAEGTDQLIIRCNELKKNGDKGVLIKASKYNQSNILDIPTIGKQTLKLLIDNDYEGVFIEKNHCLIIDQDEVTNLANTNNLFISTFEKLWLKTKKYLSAVLSNRERILLLIFVKDLKNTIIKLMAL